MRRCTRSTVSNNSAAASNDKDAFRQFVNNYLHDKPLDAESVQTLNAFLGTSIPVEEEDVDMCKAIEDIRNEGKEQMKALIRAMRTGGESPESLFRIATDQKFLEQMQEKYGIK